MTDTSFKQAYDILQKHADTLRNQQEPNIDDLLTIVTESVAAYKVCQQRIDAVDKALQQALNGAGITPPDSPVELPPADHDISSPIHPAFDDSDIPF